jgi:hypothetical protein
MKTEDVYHCRDCYLCAPADESQGGDLSCAWCDSTSVVHVSVRNAELRAEYAAEMLAADAAAESPRVPVPLERSLALLAECEAYQAGRDVVPLTNFRTRQAS